MNKKTTALLAAAYLILLVLILSYGHSKFGHLEPYPSALCSLETKALYEAYKNFLTTASITLGIVLGALTGIVGVFKHPLPAFAALAASWLMTAGLASFLPTLYFPDALMDFQAWLMFMTCSLYPTVISWLGVLLLGKGWRVWTQRQQ